MPEPNAPKRTRTRSSAGSSQTVTLRSGGSITLSGTFNVFSMSVDDMAFVTDLAQKIRAYNEASAIKVSGQVGQIAGRSAPAATATPTLPKVQ